MKKQKVVKTTKGHAFITLHFESRTSCYSEVLWETTSFDTFRFGHLGRTEKLLIIPMKHFECFWGFIPRFWWSMWKLSQKMFAPQPTHSRTSCWHSTTVWCPLFRLRLQNSTTSSTFAISAAFTRVYACPSLQSSTPRQSLSAFGEMKSFESFPIASSPMKTKPSSKTTFWQRWSLVTFKPFWKK